MSVYGYTEVLFVLLKILRLARYGHRGSPVAEKLS